MDESLVTELDEHAQSLLQDYKRAAEAIAEWEAVRVKARDQLMDWLAIREAKYGLIDGTTAVTLMVGDRASFDAKQFRADQPALYDVYTRQVPYRSLRLSGSL